MAIMDRDLNLEEVCEEGMFGIDFFKNQTLGQKIVLVLSTAVGIGALLTCNLMLPQIPNFVGILVMFLFIMVGVFFGCNKNKDFTLFQYYKMRLFGKEDVLLSKPTEDIALIQETAAQIRKETEKKENEQKGASKVEMTALLKKTAIISGIVIVLFVILLIVIVAARSGGGEALHYNV